MTAATPASTSSPGLFSARTWLAPALVSSPCFWVFEHIVRMPCAYEASQPVFLATTQLVARDLVQPGGASDVVGRLLSQAWCVNLLGSAVTAAVIVAILVAYAALLRALSGRPRPLLALVLALPLVWMHCSYHHPMKSDVSVLVVLLLALASSAVSDSSSVGRRALWTLMALPAYLLAGGVGVGVFVTFAMILAASEHRRGWGFAVLLQLVVGVILLWGAHALALSRSLTEEASAFLGTTRAYQVPTVIVVALVVLSPLMARVPSGVVLTDSGPARRRLLGRIAAVALLGVCGAVGVILCLDKDQRRHLEYDVLAQQERWPEILRLASAEPHDARDAIDTFYVTRALYHSNKLLETLVFSHAEVAPEGLAFRPPGESGETALANADLFFEMGAVAHAIRYATEAIAAYGYCPRLLRRLAMCYAAEGRIEMARSMTAVLETSIVGRSWARSFMRLLDDPQSLSRDPTIARLRALSPRTDFVSQPTSLSHEFRHIWSSGSTFNKMAMEYYLASAPGQMGPYLDFMVLAGDCRSGDQASCERLSSELGQSFWYQHFLRSPQLFDLARTGSAQGKAGL